MFLDRFLIFFDCQQKCKKLLRFTLAGLPSLNMPFIPWPFIAPTYSLASFLFHSLKKDLLLVLMCFFFSIYFPVSLLRFCTCCNVLFLLLISFFYLEIITCCSFMLAFLWTFSIYFLCCASYLVYIRDSAWFAGPK